MEISSLLENGFVILLSLAVLYFAGFHLLHISKCVNEIPGFYMAPFYTYWLVLRHIFKKRLGINPMVFVLQLVCGLCYAYRKQGINRVWLTYRPIVLLYKPETVEAILSSNSTIDKSKEYSLLHSWLGNGLLTSTGDKWRARRKLLTPCFHFCILEKFIPVFNEQSEIVVQKMKQLTGKESVNIVPLITACALEIICETTMGVTLNAQKDCETDYVKAISNVSEMMVYRFFRPWLWINQIYYLLPSGRSYLKNLKILHDFTKKVIREKKALMIQERKNNAIKAVEEKNEDEFLAKRRKKALLEMLLEHHLDENDLTEEDIREEVDTFMFEGHDTTTMAVCWALYNVGLRPDVQEKIVKELDDIFVDDFHRPVTSDDLKAMKYLECVIKESLRLYPSVPIIGRELTHEVRVLNYTLVPGMLCFIIPYALHRDPEVFPNPEHFDPDRFSPENSVGRHPYAYIPFSAGPRNCIGQRFALMEEKTILAHVLRNFEIRSLDPRDVMHTKISLLLKNALPLRLNFLPRKRE